MLIIRHRGKLIRVAPSPSLTNSEREIRRDRLSARVIFANLHHYYITRRSVSHRKWMTTSAGVIHGWLEWAPLCPPACIIPAFSHFSAVFYLECCFTFLFYHWSNLLFKTSRVNINLNVVAFNKGINYCDPKSLLLGDHLGWDCQHTTGDSVQTFYCSL